MLNSAIAIVRAHELERSTAAAAHALKGIAHVEIVNISVRGKWCVARLLLLLDRKSDWVRLPWHGDQLLWHRGRLLWHGGQLLWHKGRLLRSKGGLLRHQLRC